MLAKKCLKRVKLQHPTSSVHSCLCSRRLYWSSKAGNAGKPRNTSIFSEEESPWDKVFENIEDDPPAPHPGVARRHQSSPGLPTRSPRKQAMTAREINAFDQMFKIIFNSVSQSSGKDSKRPASNFNALLPTSVGIGRARSPEMSDIFGKLRRQSKHLRWTSEADEELDKKREAMELCDSDQQLLDWAMREVFDESKRYEENARKASEDPSASKEPVLLQPRSYPHMISILMRTFRDKYGDPHLALSIFDHARHLSVASFVFGCTTPAYNELIETRWRCFRDLRGVCDALEEMRVNGVEMDNRTRSLAETIRREVGERNMWQEESTIGSGEVWDMVARIEQLVARPIRARKPTKPDKKKGWSRVNEHRWSSSNELWKDVALEDSVEDDGWKFDSWHQQPEATVH
ncbi:hypothetical protein DAEQUDRAFT_738868 [Daedalea quercina L-15889]|uniref:Mtf2-like C-terminal domain-containing protein n=1 Tax=Daedalea quercina L-15889 TaxID=1314783 RepID=A0A165PKW9_9APHY|nr:hypothetical protein DAEQUDRAFT_738868 [Daedalea quercina L-15889]